MAVASFVEGVRDFLVAFSELGLAAGENLWIGNLPNESVTGTVLRETGGAIADHSMIDRDADGNVAKHFDDIELQVLTRSGRYDTAFEIQRRIHRVLAGRNRFAIGSSFYCWGVEVLTPPQVIESNVRGQHLISTNYRFLVRDDSAL